MISKSKLHKRVKDLEDQVRLLHMIVVPPGSYGRGDVPVPPEGLRLQRQVDWARGDAPVPGEYRVSYGDTPVPSEPTSELPDDYARGDV